MRSGMGKRILKKITAITFILILLMQMVIPLFVNVVEAVTEDNPTRISVSRSGESANFRVDYINTHGIKSTIIYDWKEKPADGNWRTVKRGGDNYYNTNIKDKLGYQYQCITEVTVRFDQSLVNDAYKILLNREADDSGYAHWENMIRNHSAKEFASEHYIRHFLGEEACREYAAQETAALAMQFLISMEALNGTTNSWHKGEEEIIKRLYRFLLGREPDPGGMSSAKTAYNAGSSTTKTMIDNNTGEVRVYNKGMLDVIKQLANSVECYNYMSNTYGGYNISAGQFNDTIVANYITYESTSNNVTMPAYPVTLKVEGESGIQNVTGEGTYHAGDTVSISATLKTGYNWVNWMKKGTLIEVSRDQTFNYTIPYEENITLLACATPISYTVVYDGNGNTGGSTPSTTHIYNRTKNIASNGYTRSYTITYNGNGGTTPSEQISNYTFYRWAQYANGTGNTYNSGQTNVGNLSSTDGATVTLYAQWEPVAVNLPSTSRNAYTFGGWYNGTSRIGGIGDSYIPTTNTTLNAHWDLIKTNVAGNIEWNDRK